jgi:hypothetical protein
LQGPRLTRFILTLAKEELLVPFLGFWSWGAMRQEERPSKELAQWYVEGFGKLGQEFQRWGCSALFNVSHMRAADM